MHSPSRYGLAALLPVASLLLSGCDSVRTSSGDVDTLSFSPVLGLALLAGCFVLLVPGVFFLFTPPRPGAARGPRVGGGALLLLFGLALGVVGVWRLSWRIDLHPDRISLGSIFGQVSIPYTEVREVKVREFQNRWRPGTLWVTIVLLRTDGTEVSLPYTTLSAQHQTYLEEVLSAHHGDRSGSGAPVVPSGHTDEPPVHDVAMESRPSVECPILSGQPLAFCTVCGQKKRLDSMLRIPSFVCDRCHRRIQLSYYSPPRLSYLGVSEGKAIVEKDGTEFLSGYGEEVVPGTGILNEGYRNEEKTLMLSRVEKVSFLDFRKEPAEQVARDVKLQWELERK